MQICHSSAEYPQSNGAAESAVKILKRLAAVSNTEHELFRAILYLQNCAKRQNTSVNPAQIFLGRNVCTPLHPCTVKSTMSWERHFQDRIREQERMRRYYDRTASQVVDDFVCNASVLVHNVCGKSFPATVVGQTGPRTYLVEFENGARSVRNRKFLMSLPRLSQLEQTTVQRTMDVSRFPPAIPEPRPGQETLLQRLDSAPSTAPTSAPTMAPRANSPPTAAPAITRPPTSGTTVLWVPRQNPMLPPRPSTTTTRSGRVVVPTLRGLNA